MESSTITPPPVREPRPVTEEPALVGKRLVVAMDVEGLGMTQYVRDYRAASQCFTEGGRTFVRIVTEVEWYAWTTDPNPDKTPACPRAKAWPAEFCWID